MNKKAVVLLAHGSRNPKARNSFLSMAQVVEKRTRASVVPAFFSLGNPGLEEAVEDLAIQGYHKIAVFPYFLFDGSHVQKDIPAILSGLQEKHPNIEFELLQSLEHEPLMPEIVFERIWEISLQEKYLPGIDIEKASLEFILEVAENFPAHQREIAARVVHATADFSLGNSLRFHHEALEVGRICLKEKRTVICDVNMVRCSLTGCAKVLCAVDQPGAGKKAESEGITRSAAGMELLAEHIQDSLVVIGNAPTALWKILDLAERFSIFPSLVVGMPVGFVGAAQSKKALMNSGLVYISNIGPKGGSPAAGAVINALLRMSGHDRRINHGT